MRARDFAVCPCSGESAGPQCFAWPSEKGQRIKEKGQRGANLHDEGHSGSCKSDLGQGGRFGVATGNTQFNSDYTLYVFKLLSTFYFFKWMNGNRLKFPFFKKKRFI